MGPWARRSGKSKNTKQCWVHFRKTSYKSLNHRLASLTLGMHQLTPLLANSLVAATRRPVTLSPLLLVCFHLRRIRWAGLSLAQGALQTTLAALAQAVKHESSNRNGGKCCSPAVHTDMGRRAEVGPFLSQRLRRLLLDLGLGRRISTRGPLINRTANSDTETLPDNLDTLI